MFWNNQWQSAHPRTLYNIQYPIYNTVDLPIGFNNVQKRSKAAFFVGGDILHICLSRYES